MRSAIPCGLIAIACLTTGCTPALTPDNPARIAELKATYEQLHKRLETAASTDPLITSAFSEKGQIVIAIRSGLIEELAGNVTRRYLDKVTVDLTDVDGHGSGEIKKKTFLGRVKVGEWNVNVELGELVGNLTALSPRVGLRAPNLIDIDMPVDVHETEGNATLDFSWNSNGVANVLCKDFSITREIRGRVLKQRHRLTGALRLDNVGDSLTATPLFPNREVQLKLDLTPKSWTIVEEGLRSQNTAGKCGTLMKPDRAMGFLRELAARGIKIKLPRSIFRVVNLPGHLEEAVKVNGKRVPLDIKAESLRIETATLWTSASVQVKTAVPDLKKQP